MKFLIDECLSPKLVELAHTRGYGESSHIVWLGRSGAKDWELMPLILDGNWTLVTKTGREGTMEMRRTTSISFRVPRTAMGLPASSPHD